MCFSTAIQTVNSFKLVAGDDLAKATAGSGDSAELSTKFIVAGDDTPVSEVVEIGNKKYIVTPLSKIDQYSNIIRPGGKIQTANKQFMEFSKTYANLSLCVPCNEYFPSEEAKMIHVQMSEKHPRCDKCDERFVNDVCFDNHFASSKNHNYCAECDLDFDTPDELVEHKHLSTTVQSHPSCDEKDGFGAYNDSDDTDTEVEDDSSAIGLQPVITQCSDRIWAYTFESPALSEGDADAINISIVPPTPGAENDMAEVLNPSVLDPNYLLPYAPQTGFPFFRRRHVIKKCSPATNTAQIHIFLTPPTPKLGSDDSNQIDNNAGRRIQWGAKLTMDGTIEYYMLTDTIGRTFRFDKATLLEGMRVCQRGRSRVKAAERDRFRSSSKQSNGGYYAPF